VNRCVSGWDGSGRRIALNDGYTGGSTPAATPSSIPQEGKPFSALERGHAIQRPYCRLVVAVETAADDMLAATWFGNICSR
jgi:hypothetical protein